MDVAGLINLIKMAARPIFISEPDSVSHSERLCLIQIIYHKKSICVLNVILDAYGGASS